jgi:hypothetical protein
MGEQDALQLVEITWSEGLVAADGYSSVSLIAIMPDIPKLREFTRPLLEVFHEHGPMARKDQLATDLVGQMQKKDPYGLESLVLDVLAALGYCKAFYLRQLIEAGLDDLVDAYTQRCNGRAHSPRPRALLIQAVSF